MMHGTPSELARSVPTPGMQVANQSDAMWAMGGISAKLANGGWVFFEQALEMLTLRTIASLGMLRIVTMCSV